MMMKRLMVVVPVVGMMAAVACGSSSPDNFVETSTRISCRHAKKCEEDMWEEAGFDSVSDCVDKTLDAPIPDLAGGEAKSFRDFFVDSCSDFDSKAARQCLAGMRKAKRQCDVEAPSSEQKEACQKVCGDPAVSELFRDPTNRELFFELAAELEGYDLDAEEELPLGDDPQWSVPPSPSE